MKQGSPKKPRKLSVHQQIIARFVTVEFSQGQGFWPNQMRLAGQLMEKYGAEFLLWCSPPNGYKQSSLLWFLTDQGKHYLSDQLVEYQKHNGSLIPKKEEIVLSPDKIGEDVVTVNKPKTLKDFLNLYVETPNSPPAN